MILSHSFISADFICCNKLLICTVVLWWHWPLQLWILGYNTNPAVQFINFLYLQLLLGIGYATQVIEAHLNVYYVVILAWAIFYLFNCFTTELPWAGCGHYWNTGRRWEQWIREQINRVYWGFFSSGEKKSENTSQDLMCKSTWPPIHTASSAKIITHHCVSTENCVDYYGENATNITNPNATSPVIEFWEWVNFLFLLFSCHVLPCSWYIMLCLSVHSPIGEDTLMMTFMMCVHIKY